MARRRGTGGAAFWDKGLFPPFSDMYLFLSWFWKLPAEGALFGRFCYRVLPFLIFYFGSVAFFGRRGIGGEQVAGSRIWHGIRGWKETCMG